VSDGDRVLAAASPNFARHVFLETEHGIRARIPLRSQLLKPGDDIARALLDSLGALARAGVIVQDGDLLIVSEKALAISQGRSYPVSDIQPTRLATWLSKFVSRQRTGVGLADPTTMQLAIDEAGPARILVAAAAGAITRPLGVKGVFYRVAGSGINAIDGPSSLNLPPYERWSTKAPHDPEGAAREIARSVRDAVGRSVDVAIIDANDMAAEVFATTPGVDGSEVLAAITDNPLGQSDEQTPFGLVRRMRERAADRERVALGA